MRWLLLVLLLALPVYAAEPQEVVQNFEKAFASAKSWQDVQAYFSQPTLQLLNKLKALMMLKFNNKPLKKEIRNY